MFNEDLIAVHKKRVKIKFDKPVKRWSSNSRFKYYFDIWFPLQHNEEKNKNKTQLLFTDTDSFCHEIETDDI